MWFVGVVHVSWWSGLCEPLLQCRAKGGYRTWLHSCASDWEGTEHGYTHVPVIGRVQNMATLMCQ